MIIKILYILTIFYVSPTPGTEFGPVFHSQASCLKYGKDLKFKSKDVHPRMIITCTPIKEENN